MASVTIKSPSIVALLEISTLPNEPLALELMSPSNSNLPNEPVDAAEPLIFIASGNKTLSASASVLKSMSPSLSLTTKSIWFPPLLIVTWCGVEPFLCSPKNTILPA